MIDPSMRHGLLLDTNILMARFDSSDAHHETVRILLESVDRQLIILVPVVVETWGLMVGKGKNRTAGQEMLEWLFGGVPRVHSIDLEDSLLPLVREARVDFVDAVLAIFADQVSREGSLTQPLAIATFDTRDFWKLRQLRRSLRLSIYDPRTDHIE